MVNWYYINNKVNYSSRMCVDVAYNSGKKNRLIITQLLKSRKMVNVRQLTIESFDLDK